ncbi:maltose ABC transporter permease [Candidatus Atribacteria bacterium HGW-Atribacteria-1]|nr:MAG: maltose ABC transporter permease [Candidatus Atribacteria bacterium HGW-Atribacteria-1]
MGYKQRLGWWIRCFVRTSLVWMTIAFALFPLLYILGTSFNPANSIGTTRIIPWNPTLVHYRNLISDPYHSFLLWTWNTIKVSGTTAGVSVFLCALGAYAFSRFRFRGRRAGLLTILLVQMFPQTLGMVAIFLMMVWLGDTIPWLGLNTHSGLILVYLGGVMGFNTWLMKGYFDSIPLSIDESAKIDGATSFQIFLRIILPLSRPILAVVFVIQFIGIYSEYMLASILLKGKDMYTLSVGMRLFVTQHYDDRWGPFAAAGVMGSILVLIIFYALQGQLVSGLTRGGVKG